VSVDVPTISREALKELIDAKEDYVLVDLREENELQYGMIPTAVHLPMSQLAEALTLSPTNFFRRFGFTMDKDDRIITYCRSGSRSERATKILQANGYHAENFKGSVLAWSEIDKNVRPH
jgi:rhodanese-related sulfurtransferase